MHPLCMPLYVLQCPRASLPKGQQNDEFWYRASQMECSATARVPDLQTPPHLSSRKLVKVLRDCKADVQARHRVAGW